MRVFPPFPNKKILFILLLLLLLIEGAAFLVLHIRKESLERDLLGLQILSKERAALRREEEKLNPMLSRADAETRKRLRTGFSESAVCIEKAVAGLPVTIRRSLETDRQRGIINVKVTGVFREVADAARRLWMLPFRPAVSEFEFIMEPGNPAVLRYVFSAAEKPLPADRCSNLLPVSGPDAHTESRREPRGKAEAWEELSALMAYIGGCSGAGPECRRGAVETIPEAGGQEEEIITAFAQPQDPEVPAGRRLIGSIKDRNGLLLVYKDDSSGNIDYVRCNE